MPFSSQNLLRQLNQRGEFHWALELKNGKQAYAFLMRVVGTSELNVTQTMNGLHALFRIYSHGTSSEVLGKFVEVATNPNVRIRSEAVQLAIGLAKISAEYEKVPAALSGDQERTIRGVLGLGLTKKVTKLAQNYLNNPGMVPFRYVEFYDVPRLLALRYKRKLLLLQSAFNDTLDEYPDVYSVYELPYSTEVLLYAETWDFLEHVPLSSIGEIPISAVRFDSTKRRTLDPSILDPVLGR